MACGPELTMHCDCIALPVLKAGDTFSHAAAVALPEGVWTATCRLRTRYMGDFVGDVVVHLGALVDIYTPLVLEALPAETRGWREGVHLLDVCFEDTTGAVLHTATYQLPVETAITHPAP